MPKGYILITEDVKDPAGMAEYAKLAGKAMAGSTLLSFDQKPEVLEGDGTAARLCSWSSTRSRLPASGTTRTPTRRPSNCGRPPPTATASSCTASDRARADG